MNEVLQAIKDLRNKIEILHENNVTIKGCLAVVDDRELWGKIQMAIGILNSMEEAFES